jgi:hypothetical protein
VPLPICSIDAELNTKIHRFGMSERVCVCGEIGVPVVVEDFRRPNANFKNGPKRKAPDDPTVPKPVRKKGIAALYDRLRQ